MVQGQSPVVHHVLSKRAQTSQISGSNIWVKIFLLDDGGDNTMLKLCRKSACHER